GAEADRPHESEFVKHAMERALQLQREQPDTAANLPEVLTDDKFVEKLVGGLGRRGLQRLDALQRLQVLMREAIEATITESPPIPAAAIAAASAASAAIAAARGKAVDTDALAAAGADPDAVVAGDGGDNGADGGTDVGGVPAAPMPGKRGRKPAGFGGMAGPPSTNFTGMVTAQQVYDAAGGADGDMDAAVEALLPFGIGQRLNLGTERPAWTRLAPWWDLEVDHDLILGVFLHGLGECGRIRQDPRLCFERKMRAYEAAAAAAVAMKQASSVAAEERAAWALAAAEADSRAQAAGGPSEAGLVPVHGRVRSRYKGVYSQPGSYRWVTLAPMGG
ncbi:unnamed protein product, partial [Phaeothamnion confervicola]